MDLANARLHALRVGGRVSFCSNAVRRWAKESESRDTRSRETGIRFVVIKDDAKHFRAPR